MQLIDTPDLVGRSHDQRHTLMQAGRREIENAASAG
jgi:hypothetical protein